MTRARHLGRRAHDRFFYRYGTVSVPVAALGVTIAGILFLVTNQGFQSPPYRYVFGTVDRPLWAALFIATGLLALVVISPVTTFLLMAALGLWAGVWFSAAVDGVAPWHAPISWAIVFLTLTAAVKRRGIRG